MKRTPEEIAQQRQRAREWRNARRRPTDRSLVGVIAGECRVRPVFDPDGDTFDPRQSPLDRLNNRGDVWFVNEHGQIVNSRWDT